MQTFVPINTSVIMFQNVIKPIHGFRGMFFPVSRLSTQPSNSFRHCPQGSSQKFMAMFFPHDDAQRISRRLPPGEMRLPSSISIDRRFRLVQKICDPNGNSTSDDDGTLPGLPILFRRRAKSLSGEELGIDVDGAHRGLFELTEGSDVLMRQFRGCKEVELVLAVRHQSFSATNAYSSQPSHHVLINGSENLFISLDALTQTPA